LEACSRAGVRLIVLDRPNPIRGDVIQGNIPTSLSIVCPWRIPIRHGLTPGEFASLVNAEANLTLRPERGGDEGLEKVSLVR